MIDSLTIFSKGGRILFQHVEPHETAEATTVKLNIFIASVLLNPTANQTEKRAILSETSVVVEWSSESNIMAVALYPQVVLDKAPHQVWVARLLENVLREFALVPSDTDSALFEKTFVILLQQAMQERNRGVEHSTIAQEHVTTTTTARDKSKQKHHGKEKRTWGQAKVTKEAMAELDFSKDIVEDGMEMDNSNALAEARAAYLPNANEVNAWEQPAPSLNDNDDSSSSWGSSLQGLLGTSMGNKVLTEEDLEKPLEEMHAMLTSKNVANDISTEMCNSVKLALVGKRMQSFHRVKTAVRQSLEKVITKLLQPSNDRNVDLLRSVVTKRDGTIFRSGQKEPYTIVMVGINGVGKSTSLAKIAYYLKSNGCSPMLAACDTFRSGAVEQLNVHSKCLEVPLYHKGYAKDPSSVAKEAIAHAQEEGHDVVLVDTAGRMQNNVPLMKALSKLVVENKPDLVLFVCEALVGNDGIDQLIMFNKALKSGGHSRQIDGIVLTKFDTVSDKVGAALTMTHVTGAPIAFIGTGQKYNHLKKLSTQDVIASLFA
jgi:signal recognition particle receptor subunit alpha